jgi:hypothetical protein
MACRFTELCIDCADPAALGRWWADVLGYEITDEDDEALELTGPPGSGPTLLFLRVPEGKTVKNRLHLDVNATDSDQDAELERLLGLGARHTDVGQGEQTWVVLADPEDNEFCLLRSRVDPAPSA